MKKTFENQWQEAFNDAEVPAPEGSWPWIEAELDKKKRKPFVAFWLNSNAFKYAAAALLFLSIGTYFYIQKSEKPRLAQNKASEGAQTSALPQTPAIPDASVSAKAADLPELAQSNDVNIADNQATTENSVFSSIQKVETKSRNSNLANGQIANIKPYKRLKESNELTLNTGKNMAKTESNNEYSKGNSNEILTVPMETTLSQTTKDNVSDAIVLVEPILAENRTLTDINLVFLNSISISPLRVKGVLPRPFLTIDYSTDLAEVKKPKDKLWFGLQSGVSPFNPSMNTESFASSYYGQVDNDAAFSVKTAASPVDPSAQDAKTSLPYEEFSEGRSRSFGIEIGKKIRKRWMLASTLRLSNARVNQRSNVFAINPNTGSVNSFYQANYTSRTSNNQVITAIPSDNIQRFRYLQVPVYLAYQLPIYSKLDLEFQTGLSTDVFLGSKITGDIIEESSFTNKNSRFRLLNLSGLAGLGLNLKVSKNWRAVIQGNFQKALFSGAKGDLDFKPRFIGVNYGLRYVML